MFLVIGIVAAAAVMTCAVLYLLNRYARSEQYTGDFNDVVAKLQEYVNKEPYPMEANVAVFQDGNKVLRDFMDTCDKLIVPTSYEKMDTQKFKTHLENVIAELSREATNDNVALPKSYAFTFADIRPKSNLIAYGIDPLALQLAEIRLLCTSLFQAKIHSLESLQRVRVSSDDGNSATDYLDDRRIITNAFSITTPYKISFRCLQGELSAVLNSLATCKDFIVVKTMEVLSTAEYAAVSAEPKPPEEPMTPTAPKQPGKKATPVPVKPVLPVVLDQKPVKVTMLIEIVRPYKPAAAAPPVAPK